MYSLLCVFIQESRPFHPLLVHRERILIHAKAEQLDTTSSTSESVMVHVKTYSRRKRESTEDFPGIYELVRDAIQWSGIFVELDSSETNSCILDGEILIYNHETGQRESFGGVRVGSCHSKSF